MHVTMLRAVKVMIVRGWNIDMALWLREKIGRHKSKAKIMK
jgi:hypothetical protein